MVVQEHLRASIRPDPERQNSKDSWGEIAAYDSYTTLNAWVDRNHAQFSSDIGEIFEYPQLSLLAHRISSHFWFTTQSPRNISYGVATLGRQIDAFDDDNITPNPLERDCKLASMAIGLMLNRIASRYQNSEISTNIWITGVSASPHLHVRIKSSDRNKYLAQRRINMHGIFRVSFMQTDPTFDSPAPPLVRPANEIELDTLRNGRSTLHQPDFEIMKLLDENFLAIKKRMNDKNV